MSSDQVLTVARTNRSPAFNHSIGRVNVILGSNGTGKSSLMEQMRGPIDSWSRAKGIKKVSLVHGNRVLYATSQSSRPRNESANPYSYLQSMFNAEDYNQLSLQRAADSVLEALCQDHLKCGEEHSEACTKWNQDGRQGEMPVRRESNLVRFTRLFSQIFPSIKLCFDPHKVAVHCERKEMTYDPNALSTGEKQVFLLLGRFINNDQPECFLIDEPDRNLNPKLAERFWEILEDWHHENSVFVYATHLPSFALRNNVDRVFLLDGEETREIDGGEGFLHLPPNQRSEFLGAIPSIVIRDKVLIVEGEDGGIDSDFYRYVLDTQQIEIVPVKDCHQVRNAVHGARPWHRITSGITMAGVIDRDYRSNDQLDHLKSSRILGLPVHEVESFLCVPEILDELLRRRHSVDNRPDVNVLIATVKASAQAHSVTLAVRRTNEVLSSHLSVATPTGEEMTKLRTPLEARTILSEKRQSLIEYLGGLDPTAVFDAELRRIEDALETDNWIQILALFEGKRLVQPICGILGVEDAGHLLKELIHHFPDASTFAVLLDLRQAINSLFAERPLVDVSNSTQTVNKAMPSHV